MIERGKHLVGDLESLLSQAGIVDAAQEAASILQAALREAAGGPFAMNHAVEMARARAQGTPLAYLTGRALFMGVEVYVAPGALIPREETELLGRTAVGLLTDGLITPARVIDMCCGSGNLTCGIAMACPSVTLWATDLTPAATQVAVANVERLGLSRRVTVLQGDLFTSLVDLGLEGTIDMVVCNPPYISSGKLERERAELLAHEPREAFDGGPYGLSIFQRVIREAVGFLKPGGNLLFEIGVGQSRQVQLLFDRAKAYETARTVSDATGEPRVVIGRKA